MIEWIGFAWVKSVGAFATSFEVQFGLCELNAASGEKVFPLLSARAPNSRAADAMHLPITRPLSLLSHFRETLLQLLLHLFLLLLYTFFTSSLANLRSQLHSWKRSFKTLEWGRGKVKSAEETSVRQGWITSKQAVFILTGWPCDLMSTSLALAKAMLFCLFVCFFDWEGEITQRWVPSSSSPIQLGQTAAHGVTNGLRA